MNKTKRAEENNSFVLTFIHYIYMYMSQIQCDTTEAIYLSFYYFLINHIFYLVNTANKI